MPLLATASAAPNRLPEACDGAPPRPGAQPPTDTLTGLPTRGHLRIALAAAAGRAALAGGRVQLVVFDLDDFRRVNDGMGSEAGDRLLQEVAQRLCDTVRPGDLAARTGDDEFAVLLADSDITAHGSMPGRLQRMLQQPFVLNGTELVLSASVGVAVSVSSTADDILREAELALREAKGSGKGRSAVCAPAAGPAARERLDLEADIRQALADKRFTLAYQPLVDVTTGAVTGVEALVRWDRPGHGALAPEEFIPVAEQTGLIRPLGRWVLIEACRQVAEWNERFACNLTLGVNVSVPQLEATSMVRDIEHALDSSGLPAADLMLEITETVLMRNTRATVARLAAIKRVGARLAIDDFGIGYSSLAYLRELPIDILKIDRTFLADITDVPVAAALVRLVIDMARTLGLETIAEGVETAEQARALRLLGCGLAQGFYFARPMAPAAVESFLADRSATNLRNATVLNGTGSTAPGVHR